jgi:hypothetical protein
VTARGWLGALAFGLAGNGALADDTPARWYLQIDNDVAFATDRWFSSAVRLARVAGTNSRELEVGFIHEIYAPEQRNWEPGRADRAPTARLMLNVARHDRAGGTFDTVELQAGVRGPAARGEQTTEFIHRAIPSDDVDWSRQLPNRFDGSIVAARSVDVGPLRAHFGGTLGTQVAFAHAGAELRYGPGSRDIDFQVMRLAATPPFAHRKDGEGWSVFAGANVRAVLRNEMIGPNYDPGGADLHVHRTVARLAGGAAWTFDQGSITFSLVHETREFDEQRKPQQFGSLAVHYTF